MKKYLRFIFEIVLIFVILTVYFIKVVVPEYRSNLGSSEKLLIVNNYVNYIEIVVDKKTDFAFLINEKGIVFHMFFFDNNSSCLYNKNIENNKINDAIKMIYDNLKANNLYNEQSTVKIYHTSNKYYNSFLKDIKKYSLNVQEDNISILDIAKKYSIDSDSDSSILFSLDIYSKEIARNNSDNGSFQRMNNKWSIYADQVYEKIENYVKDKNIENMRKEQVNYPISLIPEDSMTYYPTTDSWYYIENGSVFAYIEFNYNNVLYHYCYRGSVDNKTKGVCE